MNIDYVTPFHPTQVTIKRLRARGPKLRRRTCRSTGRRCGRRCYCRRSLRTWTGDTRRPRRSSRTAARRRSTDQRPSPDRTHLPHTQQRPHSLDSLIAYQICLFPREIFLRAKTGYFSLCGATGCIYNYSPKYNHHHHHHHHFRLLISSWHAAPCSMPG